MGLATTYAVIVTAVWYLLAHAEILRWLQRRYPPSVDRWISCAACSGFWIGCVVALVGDVGYGRSYLGLDHAPTYFSGILVCGLVSLVTTPVLGGILLTSLNDIEKASTGEEE